MEIYIITIFILFIFSLNEVFNNNKKWRKIFLWVSYFFLVFIIGFRWETGTDWYSYLDYFSYIRSEGFRFDIELGYSILNLLIYYINDSYSTFLVIHTLIYYFIIIKSFQKLTSYPQLTLLLFFSSTLGMVGSNRQLLAASISLMSIIYIYNNKKINFFVSVFISSTFHLTSLLTLVYYFFNKRIKSIYIYLSIGLAYFIGKTQIPFLLFEFFGKFNQLAGYKTQVYLNSIELSSLSIIGTIKRLLFVFIFDLMRNRVSKQMKNYDLLYNIYIMGTIFFFLFNNSFLVMISRGSFYFNIIEPLLLTSLLIVFKDNLGKFIYVLFILLLSILLMYNSISFYPDLFDPYKGIFINADFQRIMY